MGNVSCCKSKEELGDADLTEVSNKETSEIEPQVSKIQNTYRIYKSKKNLKQNYPNMVLYNNRRNGSYD